MCYNDWYYEAGRCVNPNAGIELLMTIAFVTIAIPAVIVLVGSLSK